MCAINTDRKKRVLRWFKNQAILGHTQKCNCKVKNLKMLKNATKKTLNKQKKAKLSPNTEDAEEC